MHRPDDDTAELAPHVVQNVETILALHAEQERRVGRHQKLIERVTAGLGRPRTIYLSLVVASVWIGFNALTPELGIAPFDPPPFNWLQGLLALSSLLMTTMVLTTQNRQGKHDEQRAHLDLQVNLLAEQKIAKLIGLLEELRRDLPIRDRADPVAEAMTKAVDPHAMSTAIEESLSSTAPSAPRDDQGTK